MARSGKLCPNCRGVGAIPTSDIDPTLIACVPCEGTGYEKWGMVDTSDIEDKLNDIMDKCNDIFEKVNE